MKLEDLLAMYLPEWPEGAQYAWQDYDGEVCFSYPDGMHYPSNLTLTEIAIDNVRRIREQNPERGVTKSQYLAARDRLHAATVKDMQQPQNNHDEWLEIAKDQFRILTKDKDCRDLSHEQRAEFAFDAADAFCVEMNKRIAS